MENRYKFDNSLDEKGKEKHLHTLDGKPLIGNTTALKVLSKTLTWWASGLAMAEFGWIKELKAYDKPTKEEIEQNKKERLESAEKTHKEIMGLNTEDYIKKLDKAYKVHSVRLDKSADEGTAMHEALELYSKFCIENYNGAPRIFTKYKFNQVEIFANWAKDNVKQFITAEGHCYSEKLWVGGIFDLLYEDKEEKIVILDFKSSKETYKSQFIQDAALDIEVSENGVLDKDGNIIYKLEKPISYYGVLPFGAKNPKPEFVFNLEEYKKGFEATVVLHKLINIS